MSVFRRLTLTRPDRRRYLDRWGISTKRFTVYLHKMSAPDPGEALHDHPWSFVTIPLWGGYYEWRKPARFASVAVRECGMGVVEERRPFRPRMMRLDETHRIVALRRRTSWSLIVCGPERSATWGFYTANGYVESSAYTGRELVAS